MQMLKGDVMSVSEEEWSDSGVLIKFSSVQFSCSSIFDSLQHHDARVPYLTPTPGACSSSCPLSR